MLNVIIRVSAGIDSRTLTCGQLGFGNNRNVSKSVAMSPIARVCDVIYCFVCLLISGFTHEHYSSLCSCFPPLLVGVFSFPAPGPVAGVVSPSHPARLSQVPSSMFAAFGPSIGGTGCGGGLTRIRVKPGRLGLGLRTPT